MLWATRRAETARLRKASLARTHWSWTCSLTSSLSSSVSRAAGFGFEIGLGAAGGEEAAVEDGDVEVEAGGGVAVLQGVVAVGDGSGGGEGVESGVAEAALGSGVAVGGLLAGGGFAEVGALGECVGEKRGGVGREWGGERLLGERGGDGLRLAHGGGEVGAMLLDGALGLDDGELGLALEDAGEADIEGGAELALGEGADLTGDELAVGLGLAGGAQDGLRAHDLEVGGADVEADLGGGEGGAILLGVGERALRGDEGAGAAEVGDELDEVSAVGEAVGDGGGGEGAGGGGGAGVGDGGSGGVEGDGGEQAGAGLADALRGGLGAEPGGEDTGLVGDGDGLGLGEGEELGLGRG